MAPRGTKGQWHSLPLPATSHAANPDLGGNYNGTEKAEDTSHAFSYQLREGLSQSYEYLAAVVH